MPDETPIGRVKEITYNHDNDRVSGGRLPGTAHQSPEEPALEDELTAAPITDRVDFAGGHPNIEYRSCDPFGRRYDSFVLRQRMNAAEFHRLDHRVQDRIRLHPMGWRNGQGSFSVPALTAHQRNV